MGLGHVPEEPLRPEGARADVQGRQRRGAAPHRAVNLASAARGRFGEDEAERWYLANGYRVIERNWRCPTGELDLVVARAGTTVFVEVKARANERFGGAVAAVGWDKQRRVRRVAARGAAP